MPGQSPQAITGLSYAERTLGLSQTVCIKWEFLLKCSSSGVCSRLAVRCLLSPLPFCWWQHLAWVIVLIILALGLQLDVREVTCLPLPRGVLFHMKCSWAQEKGLYRSSICGPH